MLRINPHRSSASATRYYTGSLTRQEYYSHDLPLLGEWAGIAAERLGLKGAVSADVFAALCDNLHPTSRERLTARTKSNRTVGYDFTFDPPKSCSIVHALTRDQRLLTAFNEAVRHTMQVMEADAQTRVRVRKQDINRTTGNLVWAEFLHETTRPVDGIPDPQMHKHCFVFNATFDETECRWKAGQFRDLKRNAPYYQAVFHFKLASLLEKLGYEIERRGMAFELAGISDELIAKFSRRTGQIEETARQRKITSPALKSRLGAQTREPKRLDLSGDEVLAEWRSRLTPTDLLAIERHRDPQPKPEIRADPELLDAAMRYALQYSFERLSVVDQTTFIATALRFSVGRVEPRAIQAAIESDPLYVRREVDGRTVLTTTDLIAEERDLVAWVRRGHKTVKPLVQHWKSRDSQLPDDLRHAAEHVLRSRDRVTGIRGRAGTGKTTLMKATIAAIEAQGHKVMVFAPTTETGRGTLREHAFPNANTVAHLLSNKWPQREAQGAVWWIDEAGLLSLHEMKQLADLADRLGARLVLSGDVGQHRSVRRGDSLRILIDHADVSLATLTKIRRQTGEYRDAVEAVSDNRLQEAFDKLDRMGAIVEIAGPERHAFVAAKYVEHQLRGESVLIVSPTHSEGRKVTRLVRESLKANGRLGDERELPQLRRIDLRDADLARPSSYAPGMVVEMVKSAPGHESGRRFVVDSVIDDEVYVQHADGSRRAFDVSGWSGRFHVFQQGEIRLAEGDRVRITKNAYDLSRTPLNNGSLHTVVGFTPLGDILLENGRVVEQRFAHIEHGYVTTSYAAQSKTVKHVIVAESSESLAAASREQFYVSVSRGQISATIVTDDKEALFKSIQASSQRTAALDLDRQPDPIPEYPLPPAVTFLGTRRQLAATDTEHAPTLPIARRPHL